MDQTFLKETPTNLAIGERPTAGELGSRENREQLLGRRLREQYIRIYEGNGRWEDAENFAKIGAEFYGIIAKRLGPDYLILPDGQMTDLAKFETMFRLAASDEKYLACLLTAFRDWLSLRASGVEIKDLERGNRLREKANNFLNPFKGKKIYHPDIESFYRSFKRLMPYNDVLADGFGGLVFDDLTLKDIGRFRLAPSVEPNPLEARQRKNDFLNFVRNNLMTKKEQDQIPYADAADFFNYHLRIALKPEFIEGMKPMLKELISSSFYLSPRERFINIPGKGILQIDDRGELVVMRGCELGEFPAVWGSGLFIKTYTETEILTGPQKGMIFKPHEKGIPLPPAPSTPETK